MQKKLIALAIAGAFVAPAAFADSGNVTIYGVMSASFDLVDSGKANGQGQRTNQVNDNSSRLGFKGSEDLGNGLSAVWQIESSINADGNNRLSGFQAAATGGTLNGRNTFVGLSGKSWGTAILGRHDTPYKLATRSLDMFADGIADNRSVMGVSANGATTFDGRQSNVLAYISPTFNGFHGAIAYVAGAENALTNGDNKGSAWSATGIYANGPWFGSLAYERHNVGGNGTGILGTAGITNQSERAWKLGVGYKANAFRVGFAYENISDDFGNATGNPLGCTQSDCYGHNAWNLGGGYTFGNNEVKLQYTRAGNLGNNTNTGVKQWSLGLDHNFSKRTKVFALYTKLNNDTNAAYGIVGGSNGGTAVGVVNGMTNSAPSAWSFGMTHNF